MNTLLKRAIILAIPFVFFLTSYAGAQRFGRKGPQMDPKLAERMDTIKLLRLTDLLGLDDKQALTLSKALKKHRLNLTPLRKEIGEIAKSLRDETSKEKPSEKEIGSLIASYKAAIKKLEKERERFIDEVLSFLKPIQQGKFITFQEEFPRQLRQNMREIRRRRTDRPGKNPRGFRSTPGGIDSTTQ